MGSSSPVKIPVHVHLYWPTLQALKEMGGSGSIQELDDRVVRLAGLTDNQMAVLHQGGPQSEVAYRLAWGRTHLRLIGAIENSGRGVWAVTDYGRKLNEGDMQGIPACLRRSSHRVSSYRYCSTWLRIDLSDCASEFCASRVSQESM